MDGTVIHEYDWSERLRATHRGLSEEDLKFRDFARQSPEFLRRSTFRILDEDPRLHYRQQPWLTFLGPAKLEQIKSLSLALAALIRGVPQRIFHNDPGKICEFYGLPSREVTDIILSEPNGIADSMARGDVIDTADGFKCIEFNFTPNLGGWETSLLAELHLAVAEAAAFIAREGIRCSHTPTLRMMFEHVIRVAQRSRLCERSELNVACAFNPSDFADPDIPKVVELFQRELDQACQETGGTLKGRVMPCHFGQLVPIQGRLFCGKVQAHVVLELCLGLAPIGVYRCFKAGKLLVFNGPIADVLSDKRNLALLSQHEGSGAFDAREREVIRNHIHWSRLVLAEKVEFRGEEVSLPDLLVSQRDRLVLKEGSNFDGKGVFLGRFTPEARWGELVRKALEQGGWIVQERLESLPYLYQCGEYGCAPHDVIWGPFVFGETFGGVSLRMQPKAAGGAVNLSLAATQGVVFEV